MSTIPVVAYVDPDTIHNPASGTVAPATWFTTHEANFRSIGGRVCCKIRSSADQALTFGATTTITLGTVEYNNGMTTSTANTIVVPASYAGKYLIGAQIRIDAAAPSANSTLLVDVKVNGTSQHQDRIGIPAGIACDYAIGITFVYALAVADAITMTTTNTGFVANLSTTTANVAASLSAEWLNA